MAARVALLLFGRSPSAVARLIIAVVVDTINGVAGRRLFAHVGKEILKLLPAVANGDPPTAPIVVAGEIGVLI